MDRYWSAWPWRQYLTGSIKSFFIAGMLGIFGAPIHAMDIYRWVDNAGKTQMSDRVPEQYKAVAKRINSNRFDLSEEQRQEAEARAAKDKRPAEGNRRLTESAESDEVAQPPQANIPKSPVPVPQSVCSQKWDAYYSSQNCLGPYMVRMPNGSKIRPEGFAACPIVESPYITCEYDKRISNK